MDNDAFSIMYKFLYELVFIFLGSIPRSGMVVMLCLAFSGAARLFSIVPTSFYMPISNV